jgi:hypothetical protein
VDGGGTIYVHEGTLRPSRVVWISQKGTADKPLRIRNLPGAKPVISGAGMASSVRSELDVLAIVGNHVQVIGLEVTDSLGSAGIAAWGARHALIAHNYVHDTQWNGIAVVGSEKTLEGRGADVVVTHNRVERVMLANVGGVAANWGMGIQVGKADRVLVEGNLVRECAGEGIGFFIVSNGTARRNTIVDSFSVGIYLDNASHSRVEANLVMSTGDARFFRNGRPLNGLQLANETYALGYDPAPYRLYENLLVNNVVVGAGTGLYFGVYSGIHAGDDPPVGSGARNVLVAGNTFYDPWEWLRIDEDPNTTGFRIVGNGWVFSGSAAGPRTTEVIASRNGLTFERNGWFGGKPVIAAGAGDITADPQLDATWTPAKTSPWVGAGPQLPELPVDASGQARPAVPSIGALEPGGRVCSPSSVAQPRL